MTSAAGRAPQKSPEAFRTISEVSAELDLPQHVLRFWETRFSQIKPLKRGGGRRLYRPDHIALLRGIKTLLYDDGLTIKGVQKVLREKGAKTVIARGRADAELSIERVEPAQKTDFEEGMLPLELPERAAEKLADLRGRMAGKRPTSDGRISTRDKGRIDRSITRLESLLERLERPADKG